MVPTEQPPPGEQETLQLGPRRPALVDRLPPAARRRAGLLVAGVVGAACGAAAMAWWGDPQRDDPREGPEAAGATPSISAAAEVRLVMTGVRLASPPPGPRDAVLLIDAALLHDRGPGTATVTQIRRPGRAISIRARALPLTLSVNRSYVPIQLRITPRDCALATQWTPSSQPFTLTWDDEGGDTHAELGGDHDAAWEIAVTGLLDAACERP